MHRSVVEAVFFVVCTEPELTQDEGLVCTADAVASALFARVTFSVGFYTSVSPLAALEADSVVVVLVVTKIFFSAFEHC